MSSTQMSKEVSLSLGGDRWDKPHTCRPKDYYLYVNKAYSETTKLDNSVDKKKGLLGLKLPRLLAGQQTEEQNGGKEADFMSAG